MNEQLLHLDISKRPDASQTVRIGQGDVHGTTIVAEIFDNDVALDLSGKTARFLMRQPGGHDYVRDTNCTVSGNRVTYVVDESHVGTAAGYTDTAYFEILSGSTTIASTQRFRIEVLRHAMDGATPAQSWDTEIDELIQRGEQAMSDAEQAVGDATSAIDAANQAIARIEPTIEQAAEDAAEQATADAEQRIQDAIDAVGEISELAVPLMSKDVRGGAKLEEHGGLALRDGALGIGSLVQESDGYARGGLAEVTAKGHAEQVATTGKNLLDESHILEASGWTAANGVYTGSTGALNAAFGASTSGYPFDSTFDANTQYTLSLDYAPATVVTGGIVFKFYYTDGTNEDKYCTASGSYAFTSKVNSTISKICIVYANMTTASISNVQLELGSTATEYEPYSGGLPSPRPDWEQPIEVVRGRNLLDESQYEHYDIYAADGHLATNANANCIFAEVEQGETYCVTRTAQGTATYFYYGFFSDMPQNGSVALKHGGITASPITAPSGAKYVGVFFGQGKSVEPQLTLGSTPLPYVPYGHVGMEAQGRNLLPNNATSRTINGVTFTVNADGSITANGTNTGSFASTYVDVANFGTSLNGKQITLSAGSTQPNIVRIMSYVITPSGTSTLTVRTGLYATATVPSDATDVLVRCVVETGTANGTIYPQLELGSTATEYEPYYHTTIPIPLPSRGWVAGLPDGTADALRLDGAGKCEWKLDTHEILIGSLSWGTSSPNTHVFRNVFPTSDQSRPSKVDRNESSHVLSSAYIAMQYDLLSANNDGKIALGDVDSRIVVVDHRSNSVSDFITNNASVTVLFPLATPVTEDCGYCEDWPTDIPEGAVITIPELDAVGVKYFIDSSVTELAKQWYARANSEYADRLTALEQAVAELATS